MYSFHDFLEFKAHDVGCAIDIKNETHDTVCGAATSGNEANKRKRSVTGDAEEVLDHREGSKKHAAGLGNIVLEENDMEWDDSFRPKWGRRDGHPNIKYRLLSKQRGEQEKEQRGNSNSGLSQNVSIAGVSKLFAHLASKITPRKMYPRNKNRLKQVTPPPPSLEQASVQENNRAFLGADQVLHTSKKKVRRERQKPRDPVCEDVVRSFAPNGWDPYENEFYSGDDNISDGGIEQPGKASPWKPPRMACRRCNKLKQPCDHGYPSCSLCLKYEQRCRYRDDLTGRQIRPGQLEEVEAAYYRSQQEIKQLKRTIEEKNALLEVAREHRHA